jgi:uncharacterized circularly permuted ATP-grasp superfamily protein
VKSTNESGGYGMLMGHQSTQSERDEFTRSSRMTANFIAQPVIGVEPAPDLGGRTDFEGRRVDLRPYIL